MTDSIDADRTSAHSDMSGQRRRVRGGQDLASSGLAGRADAAGTESVELREYVAVLRRRRWLMLVILALVMSATLGYTLTRTPVYVSRATVLVQPISVDPARTNVRPDQLVNLLTEREVVRSASVAELVAEQSGLRFGVDELLRRVSVTVPPGTLVLEIGFRDTDPARAQIGAQAFAEAYLEERASTAMEQIEQRAVDIRARLADVEDELEQVNDEIARTAPDASTRPVAESRRDSLVQQLAQLETELTQIRSLSLVPGRIIGPASLPTRPAEPRHQRNVGAGLAVGMLLALTVAFVRDSLDDTVRDGSDLEQQLHLPLLATLPRLRRKGRRQEQRVVLLDEPDSLAAESFRRLRTNLLTLIGTRRFTSLVITSALPGEGKSTTAANLAIALAQAGRRVLLVSADLRLPVVHRLLDLNNERGLSDVLMEDLPLTAVLQRPQQVAGLDVLASGPTPARPGDLLQSETLRRLATTPDGEHEIVLFDAPPVLAVADSLSLSRVVHGVIVVARAGSTSTGVLRKALHQLGAAGGSVVGAVLCDARPSDEDAFEPYAVQPLRDERPEEPETARWTSAPSSRNAAPQPRAAEPGTATTSSPPSSEEPEELREEPPTRPPRPATEPGPAASGSSPSPASDELGDVERKGTSEARWWHNVTSLEDRKPDPQEGR